MKASPPQHNSDWSNNRKANTAPTRPKADLDFDNDDDIDDDPEDMAELMRNFVAPNSKSGGVSSNHNNNHYSVSGGSSKAQSYKGSSSGTSNSIKYGAGGIRGIQHQRKVERERGSGGGISGGGPDDDDSSYVSNISVFSNTNNNNTNNSNNGVSNISTASKLSLLNNIKPGQAIRVKAPTKKSRSSSASVMSNSNVNSSFS